MIQEVLKQTLAISTMGCIEGIGRDYIHQQEIQQTDHSSSRSNLLTFLRSFSSVSPSSQAMARPRTRRSTSASSTLAFLTSSLFLTSTTVLAASSSFPKVDFSSLGTVAVVGSFSGLSLYDPTNPPPTFDATRSTILARRTDGTLTKVGETDQGGSIETICQSKEGILYVGGNFTRVGEVETRNIARYDVEARSWTAMGNGLEGQVRALSCEGETIYAGGEFDSSIEGGGPNVAAWSTTGQNWVTLPFYGFDGAVETIQPSQDGQSVFFGGSFSTSFSNSTTSTTPGSSTSSSAINPNAAGNLIPSLGSSLSPISLNQSDYWASPTTYTSGFGRPEYVFCPKREDGIGSSWLLIDGAVGFYIVRLYRELNVRGIRLGNTFFEGRGTRNFSCVPTSSFFLSEFSILIHFSTRRLVSIPDNQVLELTYATDLSNPSAGTATCSDNCILAHNSSIPYQDFLFPEGTTMTGFQLNVNGWYGAGGGLHLIQLLSEGSYAYADSALNTNPCTDGLGATTASSVETSGNWTTQEVVTSIAGTTQQVLVATVPGGSSSSPPSITWAPSVPQDGNYAVYFHTPGCTQMEDCGSRTSVRVTASPSSASSNSTTVDQTNTADQTTLIYNGTLSAGTDTFKVEMTLAEGAASNSGTNYQIIADYVNLIASSTNGTSTRINRGYGLFEYAVEGSQGTFGDSVAEREEMNATSIMTNSTGFDGLAFDLNQGTTVNSIVTVGSGTDTQVFVGGGFTYTATIGGSTSQNVVAYVAGQPQAVPNGGLDGAVNHLLEVNGALYAAGAFQATSDGSVTALEGLARWDYSTPSTGWEKLGGTFPAVTESVAGLAVVNTGSGEKDGSEDAVVVVGGGGSGLAFYESEKGTWNSSMGGLFLGNLTAVGEAFDLDNTNSTTYYAGQIQLAIQHATPGGAVLSSGKNGQPRLSAFGFDLTSPDSASSSSSSSSSPSSSSSSAPTSSRFRRSVDEEESLLQLFSRSLDPRSSRLVLEPRAPAPSPSANLTLPTPIQAVASSSSSNDQILVGEFWNNGSTDFMIVGGSFVSSGDVRNVGMYDPKAQSLLPLQGEQITGTVTNLLVVDDILWIGGNFSTLTGRQGFTTYNLKEQSIDDSQPPLSGKFCLALIVSGRQLTQSET